MSNRIIDLFSGMGGFRYAFEKNGFQCVYSADFDKYACDTYQANYNIHPFQDITKLDASEIPDHDVLCAGFPCQPFSIGGFRKGFEDTRGTLFFDILRILKVKKPNFFVLENVAGLLNHDSGRTFSTILNALAFEINNISNPDAAADCLNYSVYWTTFNSSDFGLPQNRKRVFIIGVKDKRKNFVFSRPNIKSSYLTDILDEKPEIKDISSMSYKYIIQYLKLHKNYEEMKSLDCLVAYEIRKSRVSFRYDNLSPCLTTKMGTGGNNVPYLVNQKRFFTIKEMLAIQGYPKHYGITNNYTQALRQLGNTVSINVIDQIAKDLKNII